jgi:hypothetical protein
VTPSAPETRRLTVIRVLAWIMAASAVGFGLFTLVFAVIGPGQEIHAVHNAIVASLLLVLTTPAVIAVARHPDDALRPLVILAAIGIAGLATMVVALTPDPFTLPFVVLIGVVWFLVPSRQGIVPAGRLSALMLVLVAIAAVPLFAYGIDNAALQRGDHSSEHAAFYHWVESSFYAVSVVLLGFLGALRPASFRLATWCGGLALAILGVASLLFPSLASAIEGPFAWAALIGGAAFVAIGEWEARRA